MPYIELPNAFETKNKRNFKYSEADGAASCRNSSHQNDRDSDDETEDMEDQFFNKHIGNINVSELDNTISNTLYHQ